jgi:hypothetical protein
MTNSQHNIPEEFNFDRKLKAGLLVVAGGFEDRARAFPLRLKRKAFQCENAIVLRYEDQKADNEPNFHAIHDGLSKLCGKTVNLPFDSDLPVLSCRNIEKKIGIIASHLSDKTAFVDISAMTHLVALCTINACIACRLETSILYTPAKSYFPPKTVADAVTKAWRSRKYDFTARYLQSAGLKSVQILPDFAGNFRPGKPTCLIVFVGYEPNRVEQLVDQYAPGALIALYGESPDVSLKWRSDLSRKLHERLFAGWLIRENVTSTLQVGQILTTLEEEFRVIRDQYDVAISPLCSKMQGIAAYLFWRRHPEVQLLFTSPVKFNPKNYSRGAGKTFVCELLREGS